MPVIRFWGTEAGLPQNTVTAIEQTRDGYLWLGTHDGLARFDGVRFEPFGLEHGLQSVDITTLLEDRAGTLWVGTYGGGLGRWHEGRIETIPYAGHQPGLASINCLAEDGTGRLWVGTAGGLRLCQTNTLIEDPALAPLDHLLIRCLLLDHEGTMWIGTSAEGLLTWRDGRLEPCAGPPGYEKIMPHIVFEDRQNRLWVSIGNGKVLCREASHWRVFSEEDGLPFAYITSLAQGADGTLWAGSLDDGLYRFDGQRFSVLRHTDGLSADDIRSLYCDREGNLWVGTRTGGLNRLSRRKLLVISARQGLTNDFTRSVAQTADGTLWVGTIGGSIYRGNLTGFEPFRPDPIVYFYASVESVLATPRQGVWWGGSGALLNWKNDRLAGCYTNLPWLENAYVTALANDGLDGIWVGTTRGRLIHWNEGRFQESPRRVARAAITALAPEPDGSLWVGGLVGGLVRVTPDGEVAETVTNGLLSLAIRTLYRDPDGVLWIGTAGGGLSFRRDGAIFNFTAEQGLGVRTVSQIVEDDHGNLWLGCSRGIYKVSKTDLLECAAGRRSFVHASSLGINDGMLAEECSGGFCPAGLKTQSGLICISTVRGLVFINPDEKPDPAPLPQPLLEDCLVSGRAQRPATNTIASGNSDGEPPPARRLTVAPGGHDIELHYTAIQFSAPDKIGFRYKLEGMDNAWTEAGDRRVAYYPHIPPGDYVFRIQACNADGLWNPRSTTLAVTVLPFFYERTGFRVAGSLALLGLFAGGVWWIMRRRYKVRLARLQMLNAIERERLRISKDMHDQIGGILTQVSQLSDMGLNETENESQVKNRLERIGNRARVAVQSLDEIVWATNPKNDNLASFVEYVSRFSDEFFEYTSLRCWQDVPPSLPALPLRADIRHDVFLAVREAFNNALKHSHGTEVWLRIACQDHQVTVQIEDNGCGFTPGQTTTGGNGLDNMRARLAENGGEARVTSAPGKGTRVLFTFPLAP